MDSGDESDDDPIYTEMLEDIRDGSQSHQSLTEDNNVIKFVTVLSKDNSDWKEC